MYTQVTLHPYVFVCLMFYILQITRSVVPIHGLSFETDYKFKVTAVSKNGVIANASVANWITTIKGKGYYLMILINTHYSFRLSHLLSTTIKFDKRLDTTWIFNCI